ncbi:HAD-IIA family hydrolase [Corynebacterium pacaense]|uniref:HAD-IIA family hydrolase n=1 Tax=Corynebacterium pacaense TaxID=1816684 RepID=UPI0009BB6C36|nr:HAD-IIA family hydrolase [Corynebacterium pacaense]
MSLITDYDSLLFDLDGTVYRGGDAIPGAVEAITSSGLPALYVTNNASRAPEVVADQLRGIGLSGVTPTDVMTSAQAAVTLAAAEIDPGSRVYILGTRAFRDLATAAGFIVVDSADDEPVAVLQGHNPETGWRQLSEAALAIQRGARYFVSNLDTTLPMERGLLVGNGSMVAAVVSATGVTPKSAGKPGPAMFHQAAKLLGARKPLAVGDRLDTDIAGGNSAGMDTLQVLTGVSGHHDLVYAVPEQRPTFIADSLSSLNDSAAVLRPGAQGGFTARLHGDTLIIEGGRPDSTPVQALRTAVEISWSPGSVVSGVRAVSDVAKQVLDQWW